MMRIIVAGVLGAVVLFLWGFLYWVQLSWVLVPYKHMADEAAVVEVLRENLPESGMYWFPMPRHDPDATAEEKQAAQEAFEEAHRRGPLGAVSYHAEGSEPMEIGVLVKGFVIEFASALLASILLCCACGRRGYAARVAFVFGLGLFICVSVHLIGWNYMLDPLEFTLLKIGDSVVGWLLAGLVIAAVVKPPAEAAEQTAY